MGTILGKNNALALHRLLHNKSPPWGQLVHEGGTGKGVYNRLLAAGFNEFIAILIVIIIITIIIVINVVKAKQPWLSNNSQCLPQSICANRDKLAPWLPNNLNIVAARSLTLVRRPLSISFVARRTR